MHNSFYVGCLLLRALAFVFRIRAKGQQWPEMRPAVCKGSARSEQRVILARAMGRQKMQTVPDLNPAI
jgi:hypothetical protein